MEALQMALIQRFPRLKHPKIKGSKLAEFCGLTIYGTLKKAKKNGRNRVWIQIRQDANKPLRVSTSLSYARAIDVQFVEDYN
jgi:hypothetical protein